MGDDEAHQYFGPFGCISFDRKLPKTKICKK